MMVREAARGDRIDAGSRHRRKEFVRIADTRKCEDFLAGECVDGLSIRLEPRMSSPSARSLSSTAPSRTSTPREIERTASASAASAPARRAAVTRRSARSMSFD